MDLSISDELRRSVSERMIDLDQQTLDISISLDTKEELKYAGKYDYVHYQSNKFHSINYFLYLVEIFNEIRYAAINAECYLELSKNAKVTKEDIQELGHRYKFYVDSAIYRYYSFWEIVGRFFNEYFDLQLEVNQNNYEKEKIFYFNREVLDKLIKNYDHKLIVCVLNYWENSKKIFDYRILKTHKRNTRVGEKILKLTKAINSEGRTLKIDVGKEFNFYDLQKLLMDSYRYARLTIEKLRNLFDLTPDEFEMLKKNNATKSNILMPNNKTIYQFKKIIIANSPIIRVKK